MIDFVALDSCLRRNDDTQRALATPAFAGMTSVYGRALISVDKTDGASLAQRTYDMKWAHTSKDYKARPSVQQLLMVADGL